MRIVLLSVLGLLACDAAFGQAMQPRAKDYLDKLPATTNLRGIIRQQASGAIVFVPDAQRQIALPVKNPGDVARNALGLPIGADIRTTAEGVEVSNITLPAVAEWAKVKEELHPQRYNEVHSALESLARESEQTFKTGALALPTTAADLAPSLKLSEEQIIKAYLALPAGANTDRSRLVSLFDGVTRTQKAIYGRLDVYRPLAYRRIHETSQSAVALVEKMVESGNAAACSSART